MDILNLIFKNFHTSPRTKKPQELVVIENGFRGELLHNPLLCTACGTCVYVCSPSAIRLEEAEIEIGQNWCYKNLQCTYCGRCVDFCPTQALSFLDQSDSVTHSIGEIRHLINYEHCQRCGEKIIPLPQQILALHYGTPVPENIIKLNALCEKCKKRVSVEGIKQGLLGK